jgi:hypothetical protein
MSEFLLKTPCELDAAYSLVIEDDGRVAYAYLMQYEDMWVMFGFTINRRCHKLIFGMKKTCRF